MSPESNISSPVSDLPQLEGYRSLRVLGIREIIVYEPRKVPRGCWRPETFLVRREKAEEELRMVYRVTPSSEKTAGDLLRAEQGYGGFVLEVARFYGATTVNSLFSSGGPRFKGDLWLLEKGEIRQINERGIFLSTPSEVVILPLIGSQSGVIVTTREEIGRPESREILEKVFRGGLNHTGS